MTNHSKRLRIEEEPFAYDVFETYTLDKACKENN